MTHYKQPEPGQPCVLEIAGRKLELLFTLKVLKALEADHQISVLKGQGLGAMLQEPAKLAIVLHYGIKTKHPDITEDWIEENVDASMLLAMSPMLVRAVTGQWPDIEKYLASTIPNGPGPTDKSESTGSTSGPLAGTTSSVLN